MHLTVIELAVLQSIESISPLSAKRSNLISRANNLLEAENTSQLPSAALDLLVANKLVYRPEPGYYKLTDSGLHEYSLNVTSLKRFVEKLYLPTEGKYASNEG